MNQTASLYFQGIITKPDWLRFNCKMHHRAYPKDLCPNALCQMNIQLSAAISAPMSSHRHPMAGSVKPPVTYGFSPVFARQTAHKIPVPDFPSAATATPPGSPHPANNTPPPASARAPNPAPWHSPPGGFRQCRARRLPSQGESSWLTRCNLWRTRACRSRRAHAPPAASSREVIQFHPEGMKEECPSIPPPAFAGAVEIDPPA